MFRAAFVENEKFKILPYLEYSEIKNQISIIIDKYWARVDDSFICYGNSKGEKISLYFIYPLLWTAEIKADDEPCKQIGELDYKELFHYRHKTIF
jgi:predicted proteasome-type protease